MTGEPIIHTKDLTKSYGLTSPSTTSTSPFPAAHGPVGAKRSGKIDLPQTILGLIQATSGEGKVLGYDIRHQGVDIRQRIGYMPEYDALNPDMDAIHQVRYSENSSA